MRLLRPDRSASAPPSTAGAPKSRTTAYPPATARAAIVQMEAVHEECIPPLVHLLRLNGVEPRVFLNARIRDLRPGLRKRFPEVADTLRFRRINGPAGWQDLQDRIDRYEPDFVVANTFQNPGPTDWFSRFEQPMLGVVHNAEILHNNGQAREMVRSGQVGPLTLAPHVTANLQSRGPAMYGRTATITSAFSHPPKVPVRTSPYRTICIPGGVNFASRDYRQVIDAAPALADRFGRDTFRFSVVGGGKDRAELETIVEDAGIADLFEFVPLNEAGFVPGHPYYSYIRGADFLLPLIPAMAKPFRTYKITSAVPTSIGVGVPLITDRWTATVYDVPSVDHQHGDLVSGLVRALEMDDTETAELRSRLRARLDHELDRAARELGWAIGRLGSSEHLKAHPDAP